MKRSDSWSADDDRLLASTIIESVSNGLTQGKAFEIAAERLTRTPVACGFRWNGVVRKEYGAELKEAKDRKRKQSGVNIVDTNEDKKSIESILHEENNDPFYTINSTLNELKAEMQSLRDQNELLKKKLKDQPRGEDLAALMELFDRARNMGLIGDKQNPAM